MKGMTYMKPFFMIACLVPLTLNMKETSSPKSTGVKVILSLESKKIALSDCSFGGEIILENISKEIIRIKYQCDPRQFLEFVVTNSKKEVVSEKGYGNIFSPFRDIQELQILPGKKTSIGSIELFGIMKENNRKIDSYSVYAIYKYDDSIEKKSNTVSFKIVQGNEK